MRSRVSPTPARQVSDRGPDAGDAVAYGGSKVDARLGTGVARVRSAALALAACLLSSCYLFNGQNEDGGPPGDAGPDRMDGGIPADGGDAGATADGGATDCPTFGSTRTCAIHCGAACVPPAGWCSEYFHVCQLTESSDPRGLEECRVDLEGISRWCYSGRFCAVVDPLPDGSGGACVDEGFCAFVLESDPGVRCRYSEGEYYVDGPPGVPCGRGGLPQSGFCGGACGDTCGPIPLVFRRDGPNCVGINEARGFGVCAPTNHRCHPPPDVDFPECERRLALLGATDNRCACMLLAPALLPEYADHGWAVSRQSCLAYREHYPEQVRCMDEAWTDL